MQVSALQSMLIRKEKIDSNLTRLEQSLMDITAAGMQPVLEDASEVIE
ncbi:MULTISPECIES: hypothetical protein [Borreliella]|uniref:Uncharacterized protein n=1 Tax=Borreliella valaisiana VS116 TaxID=445987 RepID=C0R8Z9_BORVA|nr:hypothetical protein [Borreliella valaisiana]ACN53005.1 conserved hypothetical protein [Borreliella valaisiana VS116]WLN25734.1 hypothetical protein KJD10_04745 [Borreliella valaisiana]